MEMLKKYWYSIAMMVAGIVFFLIAIFIDTRLGETAIGILKLGIGVGLFFFMDRYFLKDVDTIEEIKKGNIAMGLLFIAYAIVFFAAMLV